MKNYVIPANLSKIDALQQIKERYGLTVYFIDDTLYAGLDFIKNSGAVKYSIGVNTVKEGELKYQNSEDVKIKIKAIWVQKNNTKIEAEIGDKEGQLRTLFFYDVTNVEGLKTLAQAELEKLKFSGHVGKLTTYLEPLATAGMVAYIEDIKYHERGGRYEIRSVKTTFGTGGARRSIEIGKTVSDGQKD
jgi:hypothetical protein